MTRPTLFRAAAIAGAFIMIGALAAEARPSSGGSRGSRTHSAPPPTNTAPTSAQPMNRTVTPAPAPGPTAQQPARPANPAAAAPAAAQSGSRWGALGMGVAAGFLGAGLFGMLTGQGFMAGLGSMMGFLGFLLQIALVAGLVFLVIRLIRGTRGAQTRDAESPAYARTGAPGPLPGHGPVPGPVPGMAGGSVAAAPATPSDMVGIGPQDYEMFEQRLKAVQDAFSREDLAELRSISTTEMATYFAEDLKANADRGVVNRISDVTLLQGDLAEAWRESDSDYATVAMRYGLKDIEIERATGRVIRGDQRGEEVVELWTFRRPHGGAWVVSAIQNT